MPACKRPHTSMSRLTHISQFYTRIYLTGLPMREENFHYFPSIYHNPFFPHTIKKIRPEVNRGYISSCNQDKIVLDKFLLINLVLLNQVNPEVNQAKKQLENQCGLQAILISKKLKNISLYRSFAEIAQSVEH